MTTKQIIQIIVVAAAAAVAATFFYFSTRPQPQHRQPNTPSVEKPGKPSGNLHTKAESVNSPTKSTEDATKPPSIRLRKIDGIRPESISIDRCSSEYSGYQMILDKIPEGSRFESWLNPRGDLILVNAFHSKGGKSRYRILDTSANLICYAPERFTLDGKEYLLSFWLWKDDRTLVGIMCHYTDVDDTESADKVQIFAYSINPSKQSGKLETLETPEVPEGHVLRLEGITKEGHLVLSDVFSGNNHPVEKFSFGKTRYRTTTFMGNEKFLGCFEIVHSTPHE